MNFNWPFPLVSLYKNTVIYMEGLGQESTVDFR
jgi:hypothetical protein